MYEELYEEDKKKINESVNTNLDYEIKDDDKFIDNIFQKSYIDDILTRLFYKNNNENKYDTTEFVKKFNETLKFILKPSD